MAVYGYIVDGQIELRVTGADAAKLIDGRADRIRMEAFRRRVFAAWGIPELDVHIDADPPAR